MKLRDLINTVDRSQDNTGWVDPEVILQAINLAGCVDYSEVNDRLKKHWIAPWLCTDTWVGTAAYYLDNKPVAISKQSARKSHEELYFLSSETLASVRAFMLECLSADGPEVSLLDDVDLDKDLGEGYTVNYGSQYLNKAVMYEGKPAKIVKTYWDRNQHDEFEKHHLVDIKVEGSDKVLQVRHDEIVIPYRVNKDNPTCQP